MNLYSLSESGINWGLVGGRFNQLAEDSPDGDFNAYWWEEVCQLEDSLLKRFQEETVFVSDNILNGKVFGIQILRLEASAPVCQFLFTYLKDHHPDASVVIGSILGTPQPSARLVLTLNGCYIEYQAVAWFFDHAAQCDFPAGDAHKLKVLHARVNIARVFPWLKSRSKTVFLSPDCFWELVYSGEKFAPIIGNDGTSSGLVFKKALNVAKKINDQFRELRTSENKGIFASYCIPEYRAVNVECTSDFCTPGHIDSVLESVFSQDRSFGVRFSIFDDLAGYDSYLGGFFVTPDGTVFIEGT